MQFVESNLFNNPFAGTGSNIFGGAGFSFPQTNISLVGNMQCNNIILFSHSIEPITFGGPSTNPPPLF